MYWKWLIQNPFTDGQGNCGGLHVLPLSALQKHCPRLPDLQCVAATTGQRAQERRNSPQTQPRPLKGNSADFGRLPPIVFVDSLQIQSCEPPVLDPDYLECCYVVG